MISVRIFLFSTCLELWKAVYIETFILFCIQGDFEYVANYCHTYKMIAASIDNEEENDFVSTYLSGSPDIGTELDFE